MTDIIVRIFNKYELVGGEDFAEKLKGYLKNVGWYGPGIFTNSTFDRNHTESNIVKLINGITIQQTTPEFFLANNMSCQPQSSLLWLGGTNVLQKGLVERDASLPSPEIALNNWVGMHTTWLGCTKHVDMSCSLKFPSELLKTDKLTGIKDPKQQSFLKGIQETFLTFAEQSERSKKTEICILKLFSMTYLLISTWRKIWFFFSWGWCLALNIYKFTLFVHEPDFSSGSGRRNKAKERKKKSPQQFFLPFFIGRCCFAHHDLDSSSFPIIISFTHVQCGVLTDRFCRMITIPTQYSQVKFIYINTAADLLLD